MSHWQFQITPLTPIHIGIGEELEPYEYIILDNRYQVLDLDQFLASVPRDRALAFADLVGRDLARARDMLQQYEDLVQAQARYTCQASPGMVEMYEDRLTQSFSDLAVRPTYRSGDKAILPGSSIKGAIRTALLYDLAMKPISRGRRLQQEVFGHEDPLDDPFKALKISDALPPHGDAGRLNLVEVHVRRWGKWGPTRRGYLPTGTETTAGKLRDGEAATSVHKVQLDEDWRERARHYFEREQKRPFNSIQLKMVDLVVACRHFYDKHLETEADYLRSLPGATSVYTELGKWRENMPDNAFLLRLGWGSGRNAVSVNLGFDPPHEAISRRLLEDGTPLGWAEVRVLDSEGAPFDMSGAEEAAPMPEDQSLSQPSTMSDLVPGMKIQGVVTDVTRYGIFVDIGIEITPLIPSDQMSGRSLRCGEQLTVWVSALDLESKYVGLSLTAPA